jgi:hypothetical protein
MVDLPTPVGLIMKVAASIIQLDADSSPRSILAAYAVTTFTIGG